MKRLVKKKEGIEIFGWLTWELERKETNKLKKYKNIYIYKIPKTKQQTKNGMGKTFYQWIYFVVVADH